jgi:DNA-binding MarR family transcriptional regulator
MPQATINASTRPRPGVAADQTLVALSTIVQAVNQVRLHERLLEAAGVRVDRTGASLLLKLERAGEPLRVTDLAERLGVDTPTVTRKVQQLERLGLVARDADRDDRRAQRLQLTDEGRETIERLGDAKRRWLDSLLAGWSREDRATFATLLGAFADRLESTLDGAP